MRRAVHVLTLLACAALIAISNPISVVGSGGPGTVTIGDRGRDGEHGHTLRHMAEGWGELPEKQCGPLGFEPGTSVEYGLRLLFPLDALPAGSVVTRATLALHDASPGAAGPIELAGFVGAEPIGGDGPPDHTTGAIQIDPRSTSRRQSWNVTPVFSDDMVAQGWAGFWLRPVAGTEGLHDIDCPRDALFPILTLAYTRNATATAAPGTLVVGITAEGGGLLREGDGPWGSLTDSLCGDVGRHLDLDAEGRVVLEFPLAGLPASAQITSATLAVRDANPSGAGPIDVVTYDPFDPRNDIWRTGEPAEPTGSIEIRPVSPEARENWDVSDVVTVATIAHGWAGFLLRPADDSDGMHHIACPGDPFYPILTIQYVAPAGGASPIPNPTLPATDTAPVQGANEGWGVAVIVSIVVLGSALWLAAAGRRVATRF